MLSSPIAGDMTQLSPEQRSLVQAFASFTDAAGSLERAYHQLEEEVTRLRRELVQTNAELSEQREAGRRLEALAEASTVLAHEIRNPLASLELFAGLLAESGVNPDQACWISHMQAGIRVLSATVNNVLELHQGRSPQTARIDAAGLIEDCVAFLKPIAVQSSIDIQSQVTPALIQVDKHALMQVLLNLALNAFHAMPHGGRLDIVQTAESRRVKILVVDTGCGIASDIRAQVFQPGFTTRPGGAGLGLAVCRKIVELHGGQIEFDSCPGQGTRFSIYLPRGGKE